MKVPFLGWQHEELWGPTPQYTSTVGENYLKNNHLNSLQIALRAYRKWRNICSWKSTKTLKKNRKGFELWHFPSPTSHRSAWQKLHSRWIWPRILGSLFPQLPIKGQYISPGGLATSLSHSLLLQIQKEKFLESAAKRLGLHSSTQHTTIAYRLYPRCSRARIRGPQSPFIQLTQRQRYHARTGKSERSEATAPLSTQSSASEIFFSRGEGVNKKRELQSFPQSNWFYLKQRVGKFKLRVV